MLIVLDTNVLVSGLLSPHGPPARIVDLIVSNAVQVAFDDRVISEYVDVLGRDRFGFSPRAIRDLIDHVRLSGIHVTPGIVPQLDCPDPDDLPFAELAIAAGVAALVTGNSADFTFLAGHGVRVVTPSDFLRLL